MMVDPEPPVVVDPEPPVVVDPGPTDADKDSLGERYARGHRRRRSCGRAGGALGGECGVCPPGRHGCADRSRDTIIYSKRKPS